MNNNNSISITKVQEIGFGGSVTTVSEIFGVYMELEPQPTVFITMNENIHVTNFTISQSGLTEKMNYTMPYNNIIKLTIFDFNKGFISYLNFTVVHTNLIGLQTIQTFNLEFRQPLLTLG